MDYGYSLETLFKGQLIADTKVNGKQMRKFGFTQIFVIDLYGDVFLFREAGFK